MKLSKMWNYTLYSLTKLNSAALGMEGETWLDLRCSCHGGEEEELGWKTRGIYESPVPCFCCCQGRWQGMERNRLKEQPYERGQGFEADCCYKCLPSVSSPLLSLFAFLLFLVQIFDKPQRTWFRTLVYLAAAPGVIFFCLLKESNYFPPSLPAPLPTAALLPFLVNQGSSWGIFLVKRDPQRDRKRAQVWSG